MELHISNVVVIDDALGPPSQGAVRTDDKNAWIDFVRKDATATQELLSAYRQTGLTDLDDLLVEVTSKQHHIEQLWGHYRDQTLPNLNLALLFGTFLFDWTGKAEKPLAVCDALGSIVGPAAVKKFWRIEDAVPSMDTADIAFIDFFLNDNESTSAAFQRIRDYKEPLAKAKLLFFMSSRADVETQQLVREIVGVRTAFFETMTKSEIDAAHIIEKIKKKKASYIGNKSLENVIDLLVKATHGAAEEFAKQCASLEIHDLRLLDLSRLTIEGESISAYLSWLASESIAAKIRRLCSLQNKKAMIDTKDIGVTGQIKQGKVLFELFSDVVFGPHHSSEEPLHFGEVLIPRYHHHRLRRSAALVNHKGISAKRSNATGRGSWTKHEKIEDNSFLIPQLCEPGRYLLVLTPACDLVRCSPSKHVLCVVGIGRDFSDIKAQAREKLYGKHPNGLRHLLSTKSMASPVLITWQKDVTLTVPLCELVGRRFRRIAQMNELYAHEVKEDVLRELGRVGTQIDPPPTFALHATIKWNKTANGNNWQEATTKPDNFFSAVLMYSEHKEKVPLVILSDEFKKWAITEITQSLNGAVPHTKLKNCLENLEKTSQFYLTKNMAHKGELLVRVENDTNNNLSGVIIDVALRGETY